MVLCVRWFFFFMATYMGGHVSSSCYITKRSRMWVALGIKEMEGSVEWVVVKRYWHRRLVCSQG
jgi:hypothetical protein